MNKTNQPFKQEIVQDGSGVPKQNPPQALPKLSHILPFVDRNSPAPLFFEPNQNSSLFKTNARQDEARRIAGECGIPKLFPTSK